MKHSRRSFLGNVTNGLQGIALASLFSNDLYQSSDLFGAEGHESHTPRAHNLLPKQPHFKPRAKAVIQLMMQGGPSQVDLFDYKPELEKNHGKSILKEIAKDLSSPDSAGGLMRSPFQFAQHGQCGMWVSELMPHLTKHVDDIALVRSMYNTHQNHEPAIYKIQSGKTMPGLPTLGAWSVYGLGSENQNLPAYVVLANPDGRLPVNTVQNWQPGYLPPLYQGTRIRAKGTPILNLQSETEEPDAVVDLSRDLLGRLDRIVNTGGEKVNPLRVENAIREITITGSCLTLGIPDPDWGERLVAFCTPLNTDVLQLEKALQQKLTGATMPKQIVPVNELPINEMGKPDLMKAVEILREKY